MERFSRSLVMLAKVEAAIGLTGALAVYALQRLQPDLILAVPGQNFILILGATTAIYWASLHQLVKKWRLDLSVMFMTVLTTTNLIIVIFGTGGLDSPFYSLWLLALVSSGIFGPIYTLITLAATVIYFVVDFTARQFDITYITSHLIQIGITGGAVILAEWVHSNVRSIGAQTQALTGQLSQEQLKGQVLMSSMAEGVMVVNNDRQVVLLNKAAETLTGWDDASARGVNYNLVLKIKTPDDRDLTDLDDPFVEAWKKGSSITKETLTMTTKNDHRIPLWMSVSPVYDTNHIISGAIALFRDVSQEREVERQRSEFVSTASHEMRTPVAAVEGYLSLCLNPATATVDKRAKEYLEKAHNTALHMGHLLQDLLSVSRAEDGRASGQLAAVELTTLVKSVVDDMQFTAAKKKITLAIAGTDHHTVLPQCFVVGNNERLREVTTNLVDNAIKYTSKGGVTVHLGATDDAVTVSIADTGDGIAKEDLPHLFQKFYRVDSSATRTVGGTGLGLYLCRRFIEMYNGRIWVESVPGKGSTFSFSLPRLTEDQAKAYAKPVGAPAAPEPEIKL